jgi:hypothetical protein
MIKMSQETEIQIKCACLIAYLDGSKSVTPFQDETDLTTTTLESLDRRLKYLEILYNVDTPPPTAAVTWDCLSWRLARLCSTRKNRPVRVVPKSFFEELLDPEADMSLDMLESLVTDLARKLNVSVLSSHPPKKHVLDDEERLSILRQRLCYLVATRHYKMSTIPMTRRDIYILAADLTFDAEGCPFSRPRGGIGVPITAGAWPNRPCNCTCSAVPRTQIVHCTRKSYTSRVKKFLRFRWLRSLACWHRKDDDSDDDRSSTTSGTSSTCTV